MKGFKLFLLAVIVSICATSKSTMELSAEGSTENTVRILFTQNLYDTLSSFQELVINEEPEEGEEAETFVAKGGFAYLKTFIDENSTNKTLLVDAGNASFGSNYDSAYRQAPTLTLMNAMGYDAATFGQKDFIYGVQAMTEMFEAESEKTPVILSNVEFAKTFEGTSLKNAWQQAGGLPSTVIEKGGIRFGVFALSETVGRVNDEITFLDVKEVVPTIVEELKEKADIIVCLSQISLDKDKELLEEVEGIDVLIAGREEEPYTKVEKVNDSIIVSTGCRGQYLGAIDFKDDGSYKSYELIEVVNEEIEPNAEIAEMIQGYRDAAEAALQAYGYSFGTKVMNSPFNFVHIDNNEDGFSNNNVGDIVADAYASAYELHDNENHPVIGIVQRKFVDNVFNKGLVTMSEVMNVIGGVFNEDGSYGNNLVRVYFTGKDLRYLCELDCSVLRHYPDEQFYFSNLRYEYDENRVEYNFVEEVYVQAAEGYYAPLDDELAYPVIIDEYLLNELPSLISLGGEWIEISFRNSVGTPIHNPDNYHLTYDDGTDVKSWMAFYYYARRFERGSDGMPTVKAEYEKPRATKTENTSFTLFNHFKNTSKKGFDYYLRLVVTLFGVIIGLRIIIWLLNRKWRKDSTG